MTASRWRAAVEGRWTSNPVAAKGADSAVATVPGCRAMQSASGDRLANLTAAVRTLIESRFGRPVGIPTTQPIIADASDAGRQRREDSLARPRQPRQHMLHDQGGSNRIQREGSSELDRIELSPALLRPLAIVMEKSRRIDHKPEITHLGGERRRAFETGLVQQVDRWRRVATAFDYMLEPFRSPDGFDQGPSNTAAGAENDRHPGRGKRPKI